MILEYVCDSDRHLVCVPFSIANLHRMADELEIKRCWFHADRRLPHYDIPKKRVVEIMARCRVVTGREILAIIKAVAPPLPGEKPAALAAECPPRAVGNSAFVPRIIGKRRFAIEDEQITAGTFRIRR